jgi:hypothetical protein
LPPLTYLDELNTNPSSEGTMDYFKHSAKVQAVKKAEAAGAVADSMEVRLALIARMDAGELTLEQVQAELARIKRAASRNGQTTRARAYRAG